MGQSVNLVKQDGNAHLKTLKVPLSLTSETKVVVIDNSGNFSYNPSISGGGGGSGTVTTLSVISANGLAGTVANPTTTPAITLTTSITGLLKGNGTAILAATAGVDYLNAASVSSLNDATASLYFTTSSLNNFSASILSYTSSINAKTGSFATTGSNYYSGSQTISGSLVVSGSITVLGSVINTLTSSFAISASYASTSSYSLLGIITASVLNTTITFTKGNGTTFDITVAQSGSVSSASYAAYASNAGSASYAVTASYALNSNTSSLVTTSSFYAYTGSLNAFSASINLFTASIFSYTASNNANITALNLATASLNSYTSSINTKTGSFATTGSNTFTADQTIQGTLTVNRIVVQTITASQTYSSGSNVFGNSPSNTQVFTGSMFVAGTISGSSFSGAGTNLIGTATSLNIGGNAATVTTNANLTGMVTSVGNATTVVTNANLTGNVTSVGNATTIASGVVTSDMIADGTIVNGDINASAAIVDTKLATISTGGKVSNSATTATNANTANAIVARDASGNFSAGTITAALSGNASTATTATYLNSAQSSTDVTNISSRVNSGFFQDSTTESHTGWPSGASSWYHLISSTHSNPSNYYALQFASSFFSQGVYTRNTNNDGNQAWYLIITSANIGTQTVASASNATTAGGLVVETGRNNNANRIVRTDANGYIQAGYINSSNGNENNNSNPDRVWGTNGSDDYLRTYRTSALSVSYATSAGTSTNLYGTGGSYIASSTGGKSYQNVIQVREAGLAGAQGSDMTYAPRLGFHWSGVVASSIAMEASGRIGIFNNPGTSYENFIAETIYANSSFQGNLTGNVTGNATTATSVSATIAVDTDANLVYANVATDDFVRIRAGGAYNAGYLEIATADDGTEPIYVRQYTGVFSSLTRTATLLDGSGNTSFPNNVQLGASQNRPVQYDSNNGNFRITPNNGGWATGYFFNNYSGAFKGGFGGFGSGDTFNYYWIGGDYNAATMYITSGSNGSVGVNTSSPYDPTQFSLDVNGGLIIKNTGKTAQLVLINANPAGGGNNGYVIHTAGGTTTGAFGALQTYYGTSVVAGTLRLQPSGGSVGIGLTSASYPLDVNGPGRFVSNSSSRVLYLVQNATNAGNIIQFQDQTGAGVGEIVYRNNQFYLYSNAVGYIIYSNPADGNVGIKTNSISYALDVSGTIRATGDVIAYSDARVKENVNTITNALTKIISLRGVSYTRNDSEDKSTKVGVIAQEVLPILPEVVQQDDKGKYSVAYGNMVGVLIEAIKEQQQQINELKVLLQNK